MTESSRPETIAPAESTAPPLPADAAQSADVATGQAGDQPATPARQSRKPIIAGIAVVGLVLVIVAGALVVVVGGGQGSTATISVPSNYVAGFSSGAPESDYVFYALADKVPTWQAVADAGIFVCSVKRPPLIPQKERSMLDSGALQAGTVVTLSTGDVSDSIGVKNLLVTVPAAVNGCTKVAVKQMADTPGMLLLTDAKATFTEQSQLVKVVLK